MFIVTIENDGISTEIHGEHEKLMSGKVVKGINSIDSFAFSMLPSNVAFNQIYDFTTLVKVYNTSKRRYEFYGRVLYSDTTMAESGLITKDVTCESYFGFMCDSRQLYVTERNWTVLGLLSHIINTHNAQVEEYKRFEIGEVDVKDPNDNLYCGIQRNNTWEVIKEKLIDKLGGELRFRIVDGIMYLDYLVEIGKTSETVIAVSRNMKSIKQEKDPSSYVTRLIPLGCKLKDVETGEDTEERLDISSINDGKNYVDDEEAIEQYGIHVEFVEWDGVTDPSNLKRKGEDWLKENNKVKIKYSITALDLSLLGLDLDDFEVHDRYPIKNPLIGVDDVARINKKTIDVCEEVKSTIEVGENLKTLSDIQLEQSAQLASTSTSVKNAENRVTTAEAQVAALASATSQRFAVVNEQIVVVDTDSKTNYAALAESVAQNTQSIATNTSNISLNAQNIATNTSNISLNAQNIATNAENISLNAQNIATNTANIQDILARLVALESST